MNPFLQDLRQGSVGLEVFRLQQTLVTMCYGNFLPTGYFGVKTLQAVKDFQAENNVNPVSGYFGPITRGVINKKISSMNREKIYQTAVAYIGYDASPNDLAPDEYGCAESVTNILEKSGCGIGVILSTYQLYKILEARHDAFIRVDTPLYGDIWISPSGMGNGGLSNGHVAVCGKGEGDNMILMSNSSATGTFQENYTVGSWKKRYVDIGGYPIFIYRKV